MKRILAFLLCLSLTLGTVSVIGGLAVLAEPDAETPVREPVTLTFDSTVEYKNPYKDVEMNVTFTHEDGTVISLPCFWYKDDTFAFRFSPTKEGTWTYKTTCSDESNASLQKTGTIKATAPKGDTETSKRGFVQAKIDTRYLYYEDGTPFFWLGDTNWQAPSTNSTTKCNYPGCDCGGQFQHIVNDRVSKEFTVYQTYFSATGSNPTQGNKSYWKRTGSLPNADVFEERIDFEFQYLHEKDLVAAVGFGCHQSTTQSLSRDDMVRLARYIVARYACYNVIWILGQEITDNKIAGGTSQKNGEVTAMDVYMDIAEMVEEADGYHHPNSAHMHVHDAKDERSQRLAKSDWHDFWVVQGGHSAKTPKKDYYLSYYTNMYSPKEKAVKAFIEGELNYEEINCGGFTGMDSPRWSGWNAMLNGACGYTYGASGIWAASFSTTEYTGWYDGDSSYSYEPWYMGVDKPGSLEVMYMKRFFEALPDWTKIVPGFYDTDLADFAKDEFKDVALTEDKSVIIGYFRNLDQTTGTLLCLDPARSYTVRWFNPRTGAYRTVGKLAAGNAKYEIGQKPDGYDWVLLLTDADIAAGIEEAAYTPAAAPTGPEGTVVKPEKFTAIGGVIYKAGQKMEDPTQNLIDGDKSTVWEPSADRASQTFFYDLGKAMDLSAVAITPKEGTTIPHMRVYASNDNKTWTVLCDTASNELLTNEKQHKVGDDFVETLSGGFRYVRVTLLNAQPLSAEEQADYPYEVHDNSYTKQVYSHTALCEVALYALGEAAAPFEPTVMSGKVADVTNTIGEPGNDTPADPENPTDPGATADPTSPDAPSEKTGLPTGAIIGIIAGAAVLIAAAVILAVVAKKKKKA